MGRISRYSTIEERVQATKEQKKKYLHTKRAKDLRREQNKRAYERRTAEKSKLRPSWPSIPRAVRELAALPLPRQSHWFLREFRTQEEIADDDPLAKWDFYPPYHIPHGTVGGGGLAAIVDGLHGRRLREQYQQEARRLQRYDSGTDEQILNEIGRDINTYLVSWNDLNCILKTLSPTHMDYTMGKHLMQWKARRVVDLLEDWRVVKKGRAEAAFTCHFANRW